MGEETNRVNRYYRKRRTLSVCTVSPALLALCLVIGLEQRAEALTILSIRDFHHSVGAGYTLQRSSSTDAGSATVDQSMLEDYSSGFDYHIITPQFIKGGAELDLQWQQKQADSDNEMNNTGFRLRYNVNSFLLSRKPFPVSLSASSTSQTVYQPFAPSYETDTDALSARFSLFNSFVPSDFSYQQQTQQTVGADQFITQTSQNYNLNVRPTLGELGELTLSLNLTEGDSSSSQTEQAVHNASASARLGYTAGWRSELGFGRRFSLNYGYQESSGVTAINTSSLTGGMGWEFGKVLQGSGTLYTSKSSSSRFTTQSRGGEASLTHRLMGSLSTRFSLMGAQNSFSTGENRAYSGGVSLGYSKRLPSASTLDVSYSYSQSINEQSGNLSVVQVQNEEHTIPATIPRRIRLAHATFQSTGIEVVGAQTQLPYPASFFTVVPEGIELTEVLAGDTEVLISYSYRQDPSVRSMGTSHGVTTALNIRDGKYRIYANANTSHQKLEGGEATALTLAGTSHFDMGASTRVSRHTLSTEFGYDKNFAEDQYYLTGSWGYGAPFGQGDVTLSANDNYSWQTYQGQDSPWVNSFSLQSGYRRPIGIFAGQFKANYSNVLVEEGPTFHTVVVSANLEGRFGKLTALINSNATWEFAEGSNSSSQGISFFVRRSF